MLGLLAFAQLIISIDYNIVYVALPEIGTQLGFNSQTLQWVVSAYALAFGGFLLLGGRACDLFGARRVYLAGLALYAIGSLAGGFAPSGVFIIAARAAQGLGGALLFPSVLTLLSTRFADDTQRGRAFALWGTAGGAGMILGSLLGGVLTEAFGWRAVFLVNVPLALGAIIPSLWAIAPDSQAKASRRSFDVMGAVTATAGITLIISALVQAPEFGWTNPLILLGFGLGAALIVVFVRVENRSPDPLLPGRLLRHRNLAVGMLVTGLYMGSFGTLLYFLTIFFQAVQGMSALNTGLAFLAPMVGIAVGAQVGGRLALIHGPRAVMMGSTLIGAVGAAAVGILLEPGTSYLALVPGLVILGLGQGAGWTVMFAGATQGVDPYDQGIASGMVATTQQIGGAAGLAILVAVANWWSGRSEVPAALADGAHAAFAVAVVGILLTFVAACGFSRPVSARKPDAIEEKLVAGARR
jgi:EmrB/QacA subfamily drug resistance transporter